MALGIGRKNCGIDGRKITMNMIKFEETEADQSRIDEKIKTILSEEFLKELKEKFSKIADEVFEVVSWYVVENSEWEINQIASERAGKLITAVLEGNEKAAEETFVQWDKSGVRDSHKLIHGDLYEPGSIGMRRELVEAHPELLKNERIKDLEALVKNVRAEVRELERLLNIQHRREELGEI